MNLYLIRHGQSYVNLKDWDVTGKSPDQGLTELGIKQAQALVKWLPTHLPHLDVLYSSTMQRALETAEFVAKGYANCSLQFDDRLREVTNNYCDHTAIADNDLPRTYSEYWSTERPYSNITLDNPNVETWMHFRTRVSMFVQDMITKHQEQTVVVVCHGGVIEAVLAHAFNIGIWQRCEVWTHNTGITHFEYLGKQPSSFWRLHYHSWTKHLDFEF